MSCASPLTLRASPGAARSRTREALRWGLLIAASSLLTLALPAWSWAIPSQTRGDIIDLAKSGVGCPYAWGGTCWDPNNKTWKGADCSGYVSKCWQIPAASATTACEPHYYVTDTFYSSSLYWTHISRSELLQADALVTSGHMVLFDEGDKWGSAQVYEARGSAYGIVYRTKDVDSSYIAVRRDNLLEQTAPPPPPETYPNLSLSIAIATLPGQDRDLCTSYGSSEIYDLWVGQQTELFVDVQNTGGQAAQGVEVGLELDVPYLLALEWHILSRPPYATNFTVKDEDALQSSSHTLPGPSFKLTLGEIAPQEIARVSLQLGAPVPSLGLVEHPNVRAWVAHIDDYYDKASFSSSYTNVGDYQQQNGGDLRFVAQLDVLSEEYCDSKDNNCDGQVDEGSVCGGGGIDARLAPSTLDMAGWYQGDGGIPWPPQRDLGLFGPPASPDFAGQLRGGCSLGQLPLPPRQLALLWLLGLAGLLAWARQRS